MISKSQRVVARRSLRQDAFNLPNLITIGRVALIPLIALFGRWLWTTGDRDAPAAIDAGGGMRARGVLR